MRPRTAHPRSNAALVALIAPVALTALDCTANFSIDEFGERGAIFGTVTDQDGGAALEGVQVAVNGRTTRSDAEGSYRLADLVPGTYTLEAQKEGYSVARRQVDLGAGEQRVDLALAAGSAGQHPWVGFISPFEGSVATRSPIRAFGRASDDSRVVSVEVNGVAAFATSEWFADWYADVELTEGPNTLTAVAADDDGNRSQVSIQITFERAVLAVSPTVLDFAFTECGDLPAAQLFSVWNAGTGQLNYLLETDRSWVTMWPLGGDSTGEHSPVEVSVDPTGLAAGEHTAAIQVEAYNAVDSPQTVAVSLSVTSAPPPTLAASPAELRVDHALGSAAPAPRSVTLANLGAGSLSFSVTADEPWLSVTPESGALDSACAAAASSSTTLTVEVSPDGLAAGNHRAQFTVSSAEAENDPLIIPVELAVIDTPSIGLSTQQLSFDHLVGAGVPEPQTLEIWNDGTGRLDFSLSHQAAWLQVAPRSGAVDQTPESVAVSVNTAGLDPGSYQATLVVEAPDADDGPQQIQVHLSISEPQQIPRVGVDPSALHFTYSLGADLPAPQTFEIWNAGQGELDYTVASDAAWLEIDRDAGISAGERDPVEVGVHPATLAVGTHHAELTIDAVDADNSPLLVSVTFIVNDAPEVPSIAVSREQLHFNGIHSVRSPRPQPLEIWNDGTGTLSYTISADATWLSVSPTSGSTGGERDTIDVTADSAGLAPGLHRATLTITDDSADDSPRQVSVDLYVIDPASYPTLDGGMYHSLVLEPDGRVFAAGRGREGQLGDGEWDDRPTAAPVLGLVDVIQVAVGTSHNLALLADGRVMAWGTNELYGDLGDGTMVDQALPVEVSGVNAAVFIAASHHRSLAVLESGEVVYWGRRDTGGDFEYEYSPVPTPLEGVAGAVEVAAGTLFSLVRLGDGTLRAWGNNHYGQLGDGTTEFRYDPVPVLGIDNAAQIAAGGWHSLCRLADGTLHSWGGNWAGQLGNGSIDFGGNNPRPQPVPGITAARAIAAGEYHNHVLLAEGALLSFGNGPIGDGDGGHTDYPSPVTVLGPGEVAAVGCGEYHSLARLADDSLVGWGHNESGQLGDGTLAYTHTPQQVEGVSGARTIAVGGGYMLAALGDGGVIGWGINTSGQLGIGNTVSPSPPVAAYGVDNVAAVAAGSYHTLARLDDGGALAWGSGSSGKLGDGSGADQTLAVGVLGLQDVRDLEAGWAHSLARREDGTVWGFGLNRNGQVGAATDTTYYYTPALVEGIGPARDIAANSDFSLAALEDGTVWAWGENYCGQLGDGTSEDRHAPVRSHAITTAVEVEAGGCYSMARLESGEVVVWGGNGVNQLDLGAPSTSLLTVPGVTTATALAAGHNHSLILLAGGAVVAFGHNYYGELGVGDHEPRPEPALVVGLSDVVAIAAGQYVSAAVKGDGTVWVWGSKLSDRYTSGWYGSPVSIDLE